MLVFCLDMIGLIVRVVVLKFLKYGYFFRVGYVVNVFRVQECEGGCFVEFE